MDTGDVLHILIKDFIGTFPDIELAGDYEASPYFDFLWTGEIDGNYLVSDTDGRRIEIIGKDFTGSFIPEASTATFKLVNDADFIIDDCTDYLWFEYSSVIQRNVTVTELISNNYRTVVKYNNIAPFDITAIGILKSSVILYDNLINYLSSNFELWLFWSGYWNDYGYFKDNRIMTIGNAIAIGSGSLTATSPPSAPSLLSATAISFTRIDLAWTNPGGSYDGNKIYISTDNINFTLVDTIATTTSYSVTGLTAGTHYYFIVRTFRGLLISSDSNTADTSTVAYDVATSSLIARFTTPATAPLSVAINTLILGLKAGVYHAGGTWWDKIDCLQKYNMLAVDQCLPNWKGNVWNATLVGSPTFTAKSNIQGGTGKYINTGFIPSDGVNFQRNDASWFNGRFYSAAADYVDGGYNTAPGLYMMYARTDGNYCRLNTDTANPDLRVMVDNSYNIMTRSAASVSRYYTDVWYAVNTTSTGRPTVVIIVNGCNDDGVFSGNTNKSKGQLFGAYFTDAECDSIRILLEAFDTTVAAL